MYGVIDGYDFGEMESMRYYAPPATWSDEKKRDNAREKIFSVKYCIYPSSFSLIYTGGKQNG